MTSFTFVQTLQNFRKQKPQNMSTPQLEFNEAGLIYQNKLYKWSDDAIYESYPAIVQVYFMLYQAQTRWDTIVKQNLTWKTGETMAGDIAVRIAPNENIATAYASAVATRMTQISMATITKILKQGLIDVEADKPTFEFLFLCQAAFNENIMHFLCLLAPPQIMQVFAALELHGKLFPSYVNPTEGISHEQIETQIWTGNPFNPLPKIRFDHTTGKLE